MNIEERKDYWLEMASYDLETAEAMLKTKRYLYVGFMCHQTIEKVLKAYYVIEKQENALRTHKLTLLASQANIYKALSEEQKDLFDLLEPLNIEARYPKDKEGIMKSLDYDRSNSILMKTRELFLWIKEKL